MVLEDFLTVAQMGFHSPNPKERLLFNKFRQPVSIFAMILHCLGYVRLTSEKIGLTLFQVLRSKPYLPKSLTTSIPKEAHPLLDCSSCGTDFRGFGFILRVDASCLWVLSIILTSSYKHKVKKRVQNCSQH